MEQKKLARKKKTAYIGEHSKRVRLFVWLQLHVRFFAFVNFAVKISFVSFRLANTNILVRVSFPNDSFVHQWFLGTKNWQLLKTNLFCFRFIPVDQKKQNSEKKGNCFETTSNFAHFYYFFTVFFFHKDAFVILFSSGVAFPPT